MRLTNQMRLAFISATMKDVPAIDYAETIRSMVKAKELVYQKAAGISKADPDRLTNRYIYIRSQSFYLRGLTDMELKAIKEDLEIDAIAKKWDAQIEVHNKLRQTLTGAINACNTVKQAHEALPEFDKYLPADSAKALRSLPVLAGWPKQNKRITI